MHAKYDGVNYNPFGIFLWKDVDTDVVYCSVALLTSLCSMAKYLLTFTVHCSDTVDWATGRASCL